MRKLLAPAALGGIVAIVLVALASPGAQAQDRMIAPPHPVIQRDLTLTDMDIDIDIRNGTARTVVTQTLRNDTGRVAEGKWMMPLPEGATITDFTLIDGDNALTPEILDSDEARGIYQDIVRRMKDPGLLEYQDSRSVSVSVFPFQPGQSRQVKISFSHTLSGTTTLQQYMLPLRWAGWSRVYDTKLMIRYRVSADHDIGSVASPSFALSVNRDGNRKVSGSYEGVMSSFSSDFLLNIGRRTDDFAASLLCFPGDDGEDGYFTLSLLAAMPEEQKVIPKDVLFIFDKSGSMDGDKIRQARGALEFVVGKLREQDRFNLIYYSDNVETLFDTLRPGTSENIELARSRVSQLDASGGTDINSALSQGAEMLRPDGRPTYVIFLTDGLPTVGDTNVDNILNNAKGSFRSEVKLFAFGVGHDVNTTLLDSLSYDHHGAATYVDPSEDIEVKVSQFYSRISSPALTDIRLELGGINEYDIMPRELPDLFHNNEIFITGRYSALNQANVTVTVSGKSGEREKSYAASIPPNLSSANHHVPRLWATRKVSFLLDQIRLKGENRELLDEVDRLAVRYGIVTPYTSYLITEPEMYFREDDRMANLSQSLEEAMDEESGERAVGRSRQSMMNQAADNAAAPQTAGAVAGGSGFDKKVYGKDADALSGLADSGTFDNRGGSVAPGTTVNYVQNQTFVNSESRWVDSRYRAESQQTVRIQTYSDEYFALLDDYPALGEFLSQGEGVVFVVNEDLALETGSELENSSRAEIDGLRRALDKVRLDAVAVPAGPEFSGRRAALASLLLLASGLAGWKFSRS
ncbi:VWA domain-containing protein [bacterium]|nr:VWA domain-containing protein [bacterium]